MNSNENINMSDIRAIIFDVDGTLYDQRKLRIRMFIELCAYYVLHPYQMKELRILSCFRREREKNILKPVENLEKDQYAWAAASVGTSSEKVRELVKPPY